LKKLKSIFVLSAFALMLTGCGGGTSVESTTSNSTPASENEEETFVLKYNSAFPAAQNDWEPKYFAEQKFIEEVEKRTDGRVKIELYSSNQLVGQAESLDALARGTIDIQNTSSLSWSERIPEGSFQALPFWNKGEEHGLQIVTNSEVANIYDQALENYGVKRLFYWASSENGFMSKKPIRTTEDFKGLVINSTSEIQGKLFTEIGMGLASVPFAEQYEALLRGTIDVISFPYYSIDTYKFHEVLDYLIYPPTYGPSTHITISLKTWNKLPADIQQIITEVSEEMQRLALEGSYKMTENTIKFAEEHGVEIITLSDKEVEVLKKKSYETSWKAFSEINENTKRLAEALKAENQ
jgi:TRAP-type C4-dicarboxylate transport system substrate-binding protein